MTLDEILSREAEVRTSIDADLAAIRAAEDRLELSRARLDKRAANLSKRAGKVWRRYQETGPLAIVSAIAEELAAHFPDYSVRASGPFGIPSNTYIFVEDADDNALAFLMFRRAGDSIELVDTSVDNGQYPPNSIGALNHLGHPGREVSSIEQLAGLIADQLRNVDS
ncbi:hypothetical protein LITTLEE_208 [Mycobacterium phage LittleE]|uniref:Uncharacterized protein n=2 Tax=Omegavirus TaxID=1623292 RepID=G1FGP8_9CAUD|nr:hypothetical protein CL87_gp198 [Mycobacterium phage Thibault]YP_009637118.1 hypothetical protein FGG27_gp212 [Mycobacterium phage LittleE]AEJ94126.1 hypothetical protein THIBAULT_185 [Mycobacterium phage Thibault]AEK09585.1 hypothetical protein LITTLEE_208 [Mycobacterium phage LittleE]